MVVRPPRPSAYDARRRPYAFAANLAPCCGERLRDEPSPSLLRPYLLLETHARSPARGILRPRSRQWSKRRSDRAIRRQRFSTGSPPWSPVGRGYQRAMISAVSLALRRFILIGEVVLGVRLLPRGKQGWNHGFNIWACAEQRPDAGVVKRVGELLERKGLSGLYRKKRRVCAVAGVEHRSSIARSRGFDRHSFRL